MRIQDYIQKKLQNDLNPSLVKPKLPEADYNLGEHSKEIFEINLFSENSTPRLDQKEDVP